MDRYGFTAQVLYPNVAVFGARNLMDIDSEIHLGIVRAYNDFLVEWSSSEPGRYIPIAMLPFWDLELATDEMVRCAEMGHKGMLFTQDPTYFGLPPIGHRHWDPIWAQAQELGFPVNFHIATVGLDVMQTSDPDMGRHANMAVGATCFFMTTGRTIGELIGSESATVSRISTSSRSRAESDGCRFISALWTGSGATLAWSTSTRSTTCCRASTSAARFTGASGSRATPPVTPSTSLARTTSCSRRTSPTRPA